MMDMYNNSII